MRAEFREARVLEEGRRAVGIESNHFLRSCDKIRYGESEQVEEVRGWG